MVVRTCKKRNKPTRIVKSSGGFTLITVRPFFNTNDYILEYTRHINEIESKTVGLGL